MVSLDQLQRLGLPRPFERRQRDVGGGKVVLARDHHQQRGRSEMVDGHSRVERRRILGRHPEPHPVLPAALRCGTHPQEPLAALGLRQERGKRPTGLVDHGHRTGRFSPGGCRPRTLRVVERGTQRGERSIGVAVVRPRQPGPRHVGHHGPHPTIHRPDHEHLPTREARSPDPDASVIDARVGAEPRDRGPIVATLRPRIDHLRAVRRRSCPARGGRTRAR